MTRRPNRLVRILLKAPSRLYNLHAGFLLGRRFLRVTHRGRVSGRIYHTVLEVVGATPETGEIVVVSGLGEGSDWFRNIQAAPGLEVETGRTRFAPVHRILVPQEAADVLADYERRSRIAAPLVRAVLSRLLGWDYDGSDHARARVAETLPFVAFRPLDAPPLPTAGAPLGKGGQPRFSLTVGQVGEHKHLIELRGDLDIDGAARLLEEGARYVTSDAHTVLDAGGVESLDSGGLHALLVLARIARTRGARLLLANPTPAVQQMLTRTGAARVIDVRAFVADALEN